MSLQRLIIDTTLTGDEFTSILGLESADRHGLAKGLENWFQGESGGAYIAGSTTSLNVAAVQASGTVTFASTGPTNNQTCTIAGVTWTAKTSATPLAAEFTRSDTPATVAANLAAAINAYVAFNNILTATSASGVVTISCAIPGKVGNGIVMANVNLSNTTFVTFAGGTEGTAYTIDLS